VPESDATITLHTHLRRHPPLNMDQCWWHFYSSHLRGTRVMRVSLCTTVKGRLHHLQQTLQQNLGDNADYENCEVVILDYNSPDGLEAWARTFLKDWIRMDRVRYGRIRHGEHYNSPHAKNVAHLLGTGEVLVNIDADHFTGKGFAAYVAMQFASLGNAVLSFDTGGTLDGIIAVRRSEFLAVRGYDESLGSGWGYDDTDFRGRLQSSGAKSALVKMPEERSIAHTGDERIKYMQRHDLTQVEQLSLNSRIAGTRVRNALVNAAGYGRATVYMNFSEVPIQVGEGEVRSKTLQR
jgi:hypothetical protein